MYFYGTGNGQDSAGDTFLATGTGGVQKFRSSTKTTFEINADGGLKEAMCIQTDATVGIGTDNPDKLLHLYHATNPFIRLETATASEKRLDLYVGTSGIGTIAATQSAGQLSFRTTEGEALHIDSVGKFTFHDNVVSHNSIKFGDIQYCETGNFVSSNTYISGDGEEVGIIITQPQNSITGDYIPVEYFP